MNVRRPQRMDESGNNAAANRVAVPPTKEINRFTAPREFADRLVQGRSKVLAVGLAGVDGG